MTSRKVRPRPTSVKVGYLTFRIKWLQDKDWPVEHDSDGGVCFAHNETIIIRLGGPVDQPSEQVFREVVLHELLHAVRAVTMLAHMNWRQEQEVEETSIRMSSPVILQLLRENPELVAYLVG